MTGCSLRNRPVRVGRSATLASLLVITQWSGIGAQEPLTADTRRDLRFGTVTAGVATTIGPTDNRGAGLLRVRGERFAEVRVDLTLPNEMVNANGDVMPLGFGAADGGFTNRPSETQVRIFDPRLPLVVSFSNSRSLYIYIGGTVTPAITQRAGDYSASITVTVSYTGN